MTTNQPPPGSYGSAYPGGVPVGPQVCAFHPDRGTGLYCTRCGRPACPECLTAASVGFQCRACVSEDRRTVRQARTVAGARVGEQPLVTYLLIAVNIAVFAVMAVQAKDVVDVTDSAVFRDGALIPGMVAQGDWWRLLSSGFLHLGLIHIALNMISLYILGLGLERLLGRVRFTAVYLISLLGGSAAVMLFSSPFTFTAGASGAIFGLMGALAAAYKRLRYDMRQLIVVVGINLYITFQVSSISWQGHLGGLVAGALIGAAMVYPPPKTRIAWQLGAGVAIAVALVVVVLLRNPELARYGCQLMDDGLYCLRVPLPG